MREIVLTQNQITQIDDQDYPFLSQFRWCAARNKRTFYAVRGVRPEEGWHRRQITVHEQLMGKREGYQIDHIDGDGLNNRRDNLRWATPYQNHTNKQARPHSSRFKGVGWNSRRGCWHVEIYHQGKRQHRKFFAPTPEGELAAAQQFDVWAQYYHGEFARLNLPQCHPNPPQSIDVQK